jgi:hypothetical protein
MSQSDASNQWIINGGGFLTTIATVFVLFWVYTAFGIDLSSFSLWFVIPIGALLAGMAAASGYYVSSKWTHTMPSSRLMLSSLLVGVAAVVQWDAPATLAGNPISAPYDVV